MNAADSPDPADTIRRTLSREKVSRYRVDPQTLQIVPGSSETVPIEEDALAALDALLAERVQDKARIEQLTEALNEMTDAGYERVMGHDEPGDLAAAVQKAARVLSTLSPEWYAAADAILDNLGAVLAVEEEPDDSAPIHTHGPWVDCYPACGAYGAVEDGRKQ